MTASESITFERALPRLSTAYRQGRLVPFLGAGMSRVTCPDWGTFVSALEAQCGLDATVPGSNAADLIRRADRALLRLRHADAIGGREGVAKAVRTALYGSLTGRKLEVPPQTDNLAKAWWPLVISTNYDSLFADAFRRHHSRGQRPLEILGRSPQHIQKVLAGLDMSDSAVLWALQGYLPNKPDVSVDSLAAEVVVGHAEYRRVTHREIDFRRVFAEVFRRRSFLFLGSSLAEPYFLDLFNEVVELFGPSPLPHFAFTPAGRVDVPFLKARLNVLVMEYEVQNDSATPHHALEERLAELVGVLTTPNAAPAAMHVRAISWEYGVPVISGTEEEPAASTVRICAGSLPTEDPGQHHCLVVSAGMSGQRIHVARGYRGLLQKRRVTFEDARYTGQHRLFLPDGSGAVIPSVVALVSMEVATNQRDLRELPKAVEELLDWAVAEGVTRLHVPLFGAGRGKHFLPRFALAQLLRAYARWGARVGGVRVGLTIYLRDGEVLGAMRNGSLDVPELLAVSDIRFWVEVVPCSGSVMRQLFVEPGETPVTAVAEAVGVPLDSWEVVLDPEPYPSIPAASLMRQGSGDSRAVTLDHLGVMPGCTLRFVPRARTRPD